MNATRWPSLTEFAKYLGREGICRVEEGDKGLEVAWIDNSPEALRRQDAIRKKERQDKGDEEREQRLIAQQIAKARRDAEDKEGIVGGEEEKELKREEGEKITLNFGAKSKLPSPPAETRQEGEGSSGFNIEDTANPALTQEERPAPDLEKVSLKLNTASKPRNVFASGPKKNALGRSKGVPKEAPKKPMSEAERIMKEEIERKRQRETKGFAGGLNVKRQKVS